MPNWLSYMVFLNREIALRIMILTHRQSRIDVMKSMQRFAIALNQREERLNRRKKTK
jgi:hypothetical protein